jgi:hypothetical protein
MWLLIALCSGYDECPIHEFDIHGEVRTLRSDGAMNCSMVYFGAGFGDFGHTIQVKAWIEGKRVPEIFYSTNHSLPVNESSKTKFGDKLFMEGGTSQWTVFGIPIDSTDQDVVVSVASAVRPIHPNHACLVLFSLFIFFGVNFATTGVLQFFYFRGAMDPNEYRIADEN